MFIGNIWLIDKIQSCNRYYPNKQNSSRVDVFLDKHDPGTLRQKLRHLIWLGKLEEMILILIKSQIR